MRGFFPDFAFTQNYYVLFQSPVTLNQLPFVLGQKCAGECLSFDKSRPTRVHLIPRPGSPAKAAVLEMESCFVFHHANSYEDDEGRVIVDCVVRGHSEAID